MIKPNTLHSPLRSTDFIARRVLCDELHILIVREPPRRPHAVKKPHCAVYNPQSDPVSILLIHYSSLAAVHIYAVRIFKERSKDDI